jgi:hypothetical protein
MNPHAEVMVRDYEGVEPPVVIPSQLPPVGR